MKSYDHKKIEKKWQKEWDKKKLYVTPDKVVGKDNFYLLVEFPYPSGNLHVGHWYAFSAPDILARCLRMKGKNVLYPIGFDAFGLPAENAAIKNKLNPRKWTENNIAYMRKQIRSMGASFDWSREVVTCDPKYYKWTQWLFIQLFKKGLAYQKETAVNWCPKDKTVLANEQVVTRSTSSTGSSQASRGQAAVCERCDTQVIQKQMLQWNIRITDYADRLIDDLEALDWPGEIKEAQKNWIGRSSGAEIDFPLEFGKKSKDQSNYLLLHGYESSSQGAFLPRLRAELEKRGLDVQVPDMPNSSHPKEIEQVRKVLESCTINERTIIVGHSLGAVVAMKALQKIDRRIAGLVLVAPAVDKDFPGAERKAYWKDFSWDIDYKKLRSLIGFSLILSDKREKGKRGAYIRSLADRLGAGIVEVEAEREHFVGKNEPLILSQLLPHISVFTTRADTLFGATYLVLAPEHPWVTLAKDDNHHFLKNKKELREYVEKAKRKTELERLTEQKEKTGVRLDGVEAINPSTGEKIPIFVADYVLGHYGTGAIMAVPAHDERDFEFAKKFKIPIVEVIEPLVVRTAGLDAVHLEKPFHDRPAILAFVKHWSEDKYLAVRYKSADTRGCVSGGIDEGEETIAAAKREILEETGYAHASLVQRLGGTIHGKYYSVVREWNTFGHYTPFLFRLDDDTREQVSVKEKADHDVTWLTQKEMDDFINHEDMRIAWNRVQGSASYAGEGILANSSAFDGLISEEARQVITEKFGRAKKAYKMRDWVVSRQRYWGVPIPIIHCDNCGAVAVADKDLPVKLPEVDDYLPDGRGKSPLAKAMKWMQVKCPSCKGKAERETDTLDTFVDSSWYFLRYTDPRNTREFASRKREDNWMPVDLYSGGAEHTTMHLLYSRFFHKALYDLGLVADSEPYVRRMNRSLILGTDGQKMSKSRGNVVDPDEVIERLGADTVRMYLAFIGPYNEVSSYPWNPDGVVGIRRFLERVWKIQYMDFVSPADLRSPNIESLLHRTIKKVGEDILALKLNTAVSALMIFLNDVGKIGKIGEDQWRLFLKLLAPFAPHLAEELWQSSLRGLPSDALTSEGSPRKSIHLERWPAFDPSMLKDKTVTIVIQVNGKLRSSIEVSADLDKETVERLAREAVTDYLKGSKPPRIIFVPNRLINFVIKQ